jgi:4-hydroxymandelate oxidase
MAAPFDAVNLLELEELARAKLPKMAYDYYASGADDERTLGDNRAAFDRRRLAYRVLVDVAHRDLSTTVLGRRVAMPVLVAPTAFHKLADPEGEVATARAAAGAGTVMVLSTLSNSPVEEVVSAARAAGATGGAVWFQLYVYKDRGATRALVERVEAAGCEALVLTVDAPYLGRRERDVRNRFQLPPGLAVANVLAEGYGEVVAPEGDSGLAAYVASLLDPALTWDALDWLAGITRLPIVVKGIVRADDALRAAERGVAGLVVSNHGGRQLDTSVATLDALPAIAEALAGRGSGSGKAAVEIYLDGGIRRGTDVVKALALGARAVLVGRPVLWGLAAGGEAGVARVLALLRDELDLAMALCGAPRLADLTADLVLSG